jgi:hypothetical protein
MNARFEFPIRRITVNLAPADLPKEGGRFDLPIALGSWRRRDNCRFRTRRLRVRGGVGLERRASSHPRRFASGATGARRRCWIVSTCTLRCRGCAKRCCAAIPARLLSPARRCSCGLDRLLVNGKAPLFSTTPALRRKCYAYPSHENGSKSRTGSNALEKLSLSPCESDLMNDDELSRTQG